MLGTRDEYQGQGFGGCVLEHIDEEAQKISGETSLYIEATTSDSAHFYKRNGNEALKFSFFLPSGARIECLGKDIKARHLDTNLSRETVSKKTFSMQKN